MANRVKSVEQHYSVRQAAGLCGVSLNTIRNRIADGGISPVRKPAPTIVRIPSEKFCDLSSAGRLA